MSTVLIKNGTIVTAADEYVADLFLKDGKIAEIGADLDIAADQVVDATGKYVMPGGVDQHTHFDFSFGPHTCVGWEGSKSGVVSGTTTIVDFVNQKVGSSLQASVEEYVANKAEGNACCDYGLHGVVFDPNDALFEEILHMPEYGVTTLKLFMAYKGHPYHCEDSAVLRALQAAKKSGVTIMVHAESAEMIDTLQKQTVADGITEPIGHAISRPPIVEEEAVSRASYLAELADAPIYVVHVTAKGAMEVIRDRFAKGVCIAGETCTHYLTIKTDALKAPGFEGAKAVCSPALRSQEHLDAMWEAVKKGWLNAISSDHCAFNYAVHKHEGYGEGKSFINIPNGAAGLENRMPVVWSEGVAKGKITRQKYVELCCTNPAKINGLYPRKGSIAIGSDADIVVFDPDYEGVFSNETSLHGVDYTVFEGFEQHGRADKVFLRGELVADQGKYVGKEGSGEFIPGLPFGLCYDLF